MDFNTEIVPVAYDISSDEGLKSYLEILRVGTDNLIKTKDLLKTKLYYLAASIKLILETQGQQERKDLSDEQKSCLSGCEDREKDISLDELIGCIANCISKEH